MTSISGENTGGHIAVEAGVRGDALVKVGSVLWDMESVYNFWKEYLHLAFLDLRRESKRTTETANGRQHNAAIERNKDIVRQWFFEFSDDYIGSFVYVCQVLGYSPGYYRRLAQGIIDQADAAKAGQRRHERKGERKCH